MDNTLQHYGIKGMRWGVRKADTSSGSSSNIQTAQTVYRNQAVSTVRRIGAAAAGGIIGQYAGEKIGRYYAGEAGAQIGARVGARVGGAVAGASLAVSRKRKNDQMWKAAAEDMDKTIPQKNAKYKDSTAKKDVLSRGPEAAKRINQSMNQGMSYTQASKQEQSIQQKAMLVSAGTYYAANLALGQASRINYGALKMGVNQAAFNTAKRAGDYRRARAANAANTNRMANQMGLGGRPTKFSKRNRQGVWNVTSL